MGSQDDAGRQDLFSQQDHQVAYIWEPEEQQQDIEVGEPRAAKRRKVTKPRGRSAVVAHETHEGDDDDNEGGADGGCADSLSFVPLLNGTEKPECVRLRQRLFLESWARVDGRIQGILKEANSSTLDQVSAFIEAAETECAGQTPAAFIVTGPNLASQDLVFEQLSERLRRGFPSRFVRLRSAETQTLKAALGKIVRDATAVDEAGGEEGEKDEEVVKPKIRSTRRYLDYDLEALQAALAQEDCRHVFVTFQDSEGFDSGLISDLISLLHSWRPAIPFTLLFGIATSIDLLQARLLKSACAHLYGAQFDCAQTSTMLEAVFKGSVAAGDAPLQLGAPLLRSMLDRQHEQIAGIQAFISSLKYAYMCHFYANPLSIMISPNVRSNKAFLQPEHIEALRNLDSFRISVESAVELGTRESALHAKALLEDDDYLINMVVEAEKLRARRANNLLRSILLREAAGEQKRALSEAYVDALGAGGRALADWQSGIGDRIKRQGAEDLSVLIHRVIDLLRNGDTSLHVAGAAKGDEAKLADWLATLQAELDELRAAAAEGGFSLRSKHSGGSKVTRTTVIAQRVQLSRDSAALREEDRRLTEIVDAVAAAAAAQLAAWLGSETGTAGMTTTTLGSECWTYDSRWPLREVLVPRPRAVLERSLSRPSDYLGFVEGDDGKGVETRGSLPATSLLYQMYLETGSLINVADLWSAFEGEMMNGGKSRSKMDANGNADEANEDEAEAEDAEEQQQEQERRRRTLTQFYRGLAELRALGFVKASKRKADHIAKVKWL